MICMDLWAVGNHKHRDGTPLNAFDYGTLFGEFLGRDGYYLGPNGKPMVTTFSDGGMTNVQFAEWKKTFGDNVYFVPDLDGTAG